MLYTLVEELIFVFTNATTDRQPDELYWHRKRTFALFLLSDTQTDTWSYRGALLSSRDQFAN